MTEQKKYVPTLPTYIKKLYPIYENEKWSNFFDKNRVINFFNFGYRKKLIQAVLREIEQSQHILQIGATFGDQIVKVSEKIGYYGTYDLIDVSETQVNRCEDKYKGVLHNIRFSNQNALSKIEKKYDAVVLFMLLSETPPSIRAKILNQALSILGEKGKLIIVDYHRPGNKFLRKIFEFFNRLYKPLMEDFWKEDIKKIVPTKQDDIIWQKYTMFKGSFQIVSATKIYTVMDR